MLHPCTAAQSFSKPCVVRRFVKGLSGGKWVISALHGRCRSYLRIVFTCMERFDWARETHNADIGYFARQLGVTS